MIKLEEVNFSDLRSAIILMPMEPMQPAIQQDSATSKRWPFGMIPSHADYYVRI